MTVTGVSQPEPEKQQLSLPALALAFLKIGTIGFGGGMAIIALMEHELVKKRRISTMQAETVTFHGQTSSYQRAILRGEISKGLM